MTSAKIVWVQDNFSGPTNGVLEYQGEELWFAVNGDVFAKSSTDVAVPQVVSSKEERTFNLLRLTSEQMAEVTKNHTEYCSKTGAPLYHGDPWRKKPLVQVVKASPEEMKTALPEGKESFEVQPRLLSNVIQHEFTVSPMNVTGEYITTIKQSDISNYFMPHTIHHD